MIKGFYDGEGRRITAAEMIEINPEWAATRLTEALEDCRALAKLEQLAHEQHKRIRALEDNRDRSDKDCVQLQDYSDNLYRQLMISKERISELEQALDFIRKETLAPDDRLYLHDIANNALKEPTNES